jgi:hypothetical protein
LLSLLSLLSLLLSSFLITLAELIFWICSLLNSVSFSGWWF